jgi:hypothetical protein
MKGFYWGLVALAACQQHTPENQQAGIPPTAVQPVIPAVPTIAYTSGDRDTNGPRDTLHVGSGIVLRLEPGSKSDFVKALHNQIPYSEADLIRQKGDGRVNRIGHTLVIRPFNGPALRLSDDTHQMRGDENENMDTHCEFSGSVPGRPYWIVDSLLFQYEYYQHSLINKYSGRATYLWNLPDISPDRQKIVVAAQGLGSISHNGLQVFTISDRAISLLWAREFINWQPQQVRWLDNHTIAIEQLRFEPKVDTTYVRLLLPN